MVKYFKEKEIGNITTSFLTPEIKAKFEIDRFSNKLDDDRFIWPTKTLITKDDTPS